MNEIDVKTAMAEIDSKIKAILSHPNSANFSSKVRVTLIEIAERAQLVGLFNSGHFCFPYPLSKEELVEAFESDES